MRELRALNGHFLRYKWRLLSGIAFVLLSNYFGILAPQVTGYVVDRVTHQLDRVAGPGEGIHKSYYDPLVSVFIRKVETSGFDFGTLVLLCGAMLLASALLRGFFMFLMRQTLIVMSRHIEFDQKAGIYRHYQRLDTLFYKTHRTGDLMSRMSEDVSRVRMYTGPSIMYMSNLVALISFSLYFMFREDALLSLIVLSPLPILAFTIYRVNDVINRRSEHIQSQLGELTSRAQESYAGIRVIKSFVQESAMAAFFASVSERYRRSAVGLAMVEAIYFPSISLLIGISTLLTICIGGIYQVHHRISPGTIAEFVVYINMLTFPVSAIGWVASMIQRAAASQKRINEFLQTPPAITDPPGALELTQPGDIAFDHVSLRFPHTGILALDDVSLRIRKGEKVAILGRTGSGKSTLAHLLLRLLDPDRGIVRINDRDIRDYTLASLRRQVRFVPQDVFLFSDTVANNIRFGEPGLDDPAVRQAARQAAIDEEIDAFPNGFDTLVGERGVNLSGGQKQRISIARALAAPNGILLFDDCLSAVDARTEHRILEGLREAMQDRTTILITHRVITGIPFDRIIILDNGRIIEEGTHASLMASGTAYRDIVERQQSDILDPRPPEL
jgi:ATP-binding cassette subfamily B multidrug efflux pump